MDLDRDANKMLALLASLAFVVAAVVGLAAIAGSWTRYRDVALGNLAALHERDAPRDYRVRAMSVVGRAVPSQTARRESKRVLRSPVRRAAGLRAAA